jgi:4-amino-4-deoxy-L-arabinose transferase-like glycosyltransferase
MFSRLHNRAGHYLLLGLLGGCLFFTNLGGASLWDLDEGRNLTCAFEMMEAGNWVIPTFNGLLRPDKPVLLYWLQIASYQKFGVNEFAGRLPSALAALMTVLICYELARSMFSVSTGLLAGVIAAATPMLCGAARFANPDALLNLFIVLTLWLFWIGWRNPRLWWFVAIGAAEGFGMLAKGAVAVVLPVSIMVAFFFWQRRLRAMWDIRQLAGVLAFCLIALPWYIRVGVETKGVFLWEFFYNHHVDRFAHTMENHRGGVWYYPLVITIGTIPWAVFLGPAIWYGIWSGLRWPCSQCGLRWLAAAENPVGPESVTEDRTVAAYRLLWSWMGLFLVFFTVSATKLPNYALPIVVPVAILIARFLDRWRLGTLQVPAWVWPASLSCLALTGIGLTIGLAVAGSALPLPELRPWAMLGLILLTGAAGAAGCLYAGQRGAAVASIAAAGAVMLALLGSYGMTVLESHKTPRELVTQVGAQSRQQDIRVVAWQLDHLPSLNFYVQRNVVMCERECEVSTYLNYPLPVYVFLPISEWERVRASVTVPWRELGRRPDLYKRDDVIAIYNR